MKKATFIFIHLSVIVAILFISSCSKSSNSNSTKSTLYDSLGGTAMVPDPAASGTQIESGRLLIRSILDSTIFVIAADSRINGHFTTLLTEVGMSNLSGFTALSNNLTDFVCAVTGAKDFTYGGKNMKDAHDPATNSRMHGKASNSDMDAFEVDLVAGAAKNGVTTSNQALVSVANLVESLRHVVVQM